MRGIMGALLVGVASPLFVTAAAATDFDLGAEINPFQYNPGVPTAFDKAIFGDAPGGLSFTSQAGKLFATTGLSQIGIASDDNEVTFTGSGSNWNSELHVYIGVAGAGNKLTVSNGAKLSFDTPIAVLDPAAADVIVGYDDGGDSNTLTVTGTSTTLTADGTIYVGRNGDNNEMQIADGAVVTSLQGRIGGGSGSVSSAGENSVTVNGSGSKWQMSGTLRIGADGTAANNGNTVLIENGGALATGKTIHLGFGGQSEDNGLTITGAGSNVTTLGDVRIGSNAASTGNLVTVGNHGSLNVAGALFVSDANGLDLSNGAEVTVGSLAFTETDALLAKIGSELTFGIDADNLAKLAATTTATLGGEFIATFSGALEQRIDIVTAAGGITGEFDDVDTSDLGRGFAATMVYGLPNARPIAPTSVAYLAIEAKLGAEDALGRNQRAVAGGLNTSFNGGQRFGQGFVDIYDLANPALQTALTLLSGESNAYGITQGVWGADRSLLDTLRGRALRGDTGGWAVVSGASGSAAGNLENGTHDSDSSRSAMVGGLSLAGSGAFSAGMAVSAGQSAWTLGMLGSGDLNTTQVGGYVKADAGDAYVMAEGVLGSHDMTARRSYSADPSDPSPLEAVFDGGLRSDALRLEAGYALALSATTSVTPYLAYALGRTVLGRAVAETGGGAGGYDLTYGAQTVQSRTTEIGARLDAAVGETAQVFADVALSSANNDSVNASFSGLADSGFDVAGAGGIDTLTRVALGASLDLNAMSMATVSVNAAFGDVSDMGASIGLRFNW